VPVASSTATRTPAPIHHQVAALQSIERLRFRIRLAV
jgi:hypothetical protein